jgi:hypothetical protein
MSSPSETPEPLEQSLAPPAAPHVAPPVTPPPAVCTMCGATPVRCVQLCKTCYNRTRKQQSRENKKCEALVGKGRTNDWKKRHPVSSLVKPLWRPVLPATSCDYNPDDPPANPSPTDAIEPTHKYCYASDSESDEDEHRSAVEQVRKWKHTETQLKRMALRQLLCIAKESKVHRQLSESYYLGRYVKAMFPRAEWDKWGVFCANVEGSSMYWTPRHDKDFFNNLLEYCFKNAKVNEFFEKYHRYDRPGTVMCFNNWFYSTRKLGSDAINSIEEYARAKARFHKAHAPEWRTINNILHDTRRLYRNRRGAFFPGLMARHEPVDDELEKWLRDCLEERFNNFVDQFRRFKDY